RRQPIGRAGPGIPDGLATGQERGRSAHDRGQRGRARVEGGGQEVAGDAGRTLRLSRSALGGAGVAAVVLAGVTLALVTQNRRLASGEEHVLAWALDAGKQGAEPPIAIDLLG